MLEKEKDILINCQLKSIKNKNYTERKKEDAKIFKV